MCHQRGSVIAEVVLKRVIRPDGDSDPRTPDLLAQELVEKLNDRNNIDARDYRECPRCTCPQIRPADFKPQALLFPPDIAPKPAALMRVRPAYTRHAHRAWP